METALIDDRALSKLRWRCRRGLLENDLFIERFFNRYGNAVSPDVAQGLNDLMTLSDNDLLDVMLSRKSIFQVEPLLATPQIQHVLTMLKGKL
jgi:antitoxin CptB